jgi:hypothetical protein
MFYFPGLSSHTFWQRENMQHYELESSSAASSSSEHDLRMIRKSPNADEVFPWLKELEMPENIKAMRDEYNALVQVLHSTRIHVLLFLK